MAINHNYYTLVHSYALNKGMDRVEADNIATTLAVLIPMRHDYGLQDGHTWPNNDYVVENIKKLHQGKPYQRIIPFDLAIPLIKVDSINQLPATTTYGQRYYVRSGNLFMETQLNGMTETVKKMQSLQITEPLDIDPEQLARLREKAAEQGMIIEVWDKGANHPDNVAGLAKLKEALTAADDKAAPKVQPERKEERNSWSNPTGKIKFRERPSNRLTRMRNNKRRG